MPGPWLHQAGVAIKLWKHPAFVCILDPSGLLRCRHSGLLCGVQYLELQCWFVRLQLEYNPWRACEALLDIFELFRDLAAVGGTLLWTLQSSSELVVELLKRTRWREIEPVWVWLSHRLTIAKVPMATPTNASCNGATLNAIFFVLFCFYFPPSADWNYDHDGAGARQILKMPTCRMSLTGQRYRVKITLYPF